MCSATWVHPTHGVTKCGQCMECRLAYSREWAVRITHEARMHERNCFLTLTYDEVNLPQYGQLLKRDLQLFFKRLRLITGPFRYVACGEYGELRRRPHFHVCLFGQDFREDRIPYSTSAEGDPVFVSQTVAKVWQKSTFPMGHAIGSLTFESAAYVARYITKRVKGPGASYLPLGLDSESGELVMPNPEFLLCSKGIGKEWYDKYFMIDVFPHARVITEQGTPSPVPAYYKRKLREQNAMMAFDLRYRASLNMAKDYPRRKKEDAPERRAARSVYARARTSLFPRDVKGS